MNVVRGRFLVPVLLTAAVALVALNTWLAYDSVRVLEQAQFWVRHTYQVIAQVEVIIGSAKDAETGERGFLITSSDEFLVPYNNALRDLPGEMDAFQSMTSDNAAQQDRITEMRIRMERRLALLKEGIDRRRAGESDTNVALTVTGSGKIEMDSLRELANTMQNDERRLLAERQKIADASSVRAKITVGVASALDFLLLLLITRYFLRERSIRVEAERATKRLEIANAANVAITAEVRSLNATLEERVRQRTAELESINRELEAFSYSVSHDLRAPLRTVDGFSLALEEDYSNAIDATGKDYIARVRAGVQRMGMLIDALLQLSRITRADLDRTDFDLSELADDVVANLAQDHADRVIEFRVERGMRANGDPRLLRVALENLMGNSVKFTSKVPHALIEFGWDRAENAWFVRDNGAGFDMEYANKLFSAFHRLHGDRDFKGSGIGLATVARVIRRHHGRIWAKAQVDRGATFWFTLTSET